MKTQWGSYGQAIQDELKKLTETRFFERLWRKDAALWEDDAAHQKEIRQRLGWLEAPGAYAAQTNEILAFVEKARRDGFKFAVLLGMGGSSLAPEVLETIFGTAPGYLKLLVLDSTDPRRIRDVESAIGREKTLFIVASKSGTTVESLSLYKYFHAKIQSGDAFIAITDPGLSLEKTAKEQGFRHIFLNDPNVGGRYSALTLFGLVPAALVGVDIKGLLARAAASEVIASCADASKNPAAILGVSMAVLAGQGRDKLTILTPPGWEVFGDWAEQLIAESTGKEGKGICPIARETPGAVEEYGADRNFVVIGGPETCGAECQKRCDALAAQGHPFTRTQIRDNLDLGHQFFLWEVATAVAGAVMKIDPFDQPNVQEAKTLTKQVLKGTKPGASLLPQAQSEEDLRRFWQKLTPADSVNILAFLPMRPEVMAGLRSVAEAIRRKRHCAVNIGIGPRYLHSTGQLHKGGPDRAVFIVMTSRVADSEDLAIPGDDYTFRQLLEAQTRGDLEALRAKGRRTVYIEVNDPAQIQLTPL